MALTDPTTDGISASFAIADIQIGEPGTVIGFAGARVIDLWVWKPCPRGASAPSMICARGIVDMIVGRADLPKSLGRITDRLPPSPLPALGAPAPHPAELVAA